MSRAPPRWLGRDLVLALHERCLHEAGGAAGLREPTLLDAAMARPLHRYQYEQSGLYELAAAYAYGILNNHPFLDGNKRTAFLAAFVFLLDNGCDPGADPAEAALMTLGLADKSVSEAQYAAWLRSLCESS